MAPTANPVSLLPLRAGLSFDVDGPPTTRVRAWCGDALALEPGATHFVYAVEGASVIDAAAGRFPLGEGMFASVAGATVAPARDRHGAGLVVSRFDVSGMFHVGGPIEPRGRLRYIDGCTDSLLVPPPLRGDPCLNHLHIPAGTRQTRHTHPSVRAGVIARGHGRCVTPDREHPLERGLVFVIPPRCTHSFWTDDSALDVVVYHPDSDTGPTDEDHPMINRTVIPRA